MNRPRVLHLIDTGGPGGAETIYLELVKGLDDFGWESFPVVPERDWLSGELARNGREVIEAASHGSFDVSYLIQLRRLIAQRDIDLIHAHLLGSSIYGTLAVIDSDKPVVCTFHGQPDIDRGDRFWAIKSRILNRGRNQIVCVSDSLRAHFVRSGQLPAGTTSIANGVDMAFASDPVSKHLRDELRLPETGPVIGAVGNVRPSKGYDVLLRAFARLRERLPECQLIIAGHFDPASDLYRSLEAQITNAGLTGVHFIGFRDDLANVLGSLDVFVLSSRDEGFSLATVQAMAASLPVVATRCGGPEDIIGASDAALMVPTDDHHSLAQAIRMVLDQPERAKAMGMAGRNRALEEFTVSKMVSRYDSLYRKLLG